MRMIEGLNPVREALRAGTDIHRIYLKPERRRSPALGEIIERAQKGGVAVEEIDAGELDRRSESHSHQGIMAEAEELRFYDPEQIVLWARERGEKPFILVLDQIQDPHNLGSIIRSAEGAGAHGMVIPERRAAQPSALVNKVSAGALEHLPLARVKNISRTLSLLNDRGIWSCGADGEAPRSLYTANLDLPLALVIGNEGRGLRRLVRQRCEFLVRVPMRGAISSLNAGVAAGILIYEVMRQRMN